eukprot:768689-Hanusia_phi.AAC.5
MAQKVSIPLLLFYLVFYSCLNVQPNLPILRQHDAALFVGANAALLNHASMIPEFSMFAFGCAMLSNFLFAARGTYAKICMEKGPKLSGADLFAVNTIFAFVLMAPITFVMEGQNAISGFEKLTTGKAPVDFMALVNGGEGACMEAG